MGRKYKRRNKKKRQVRRKKRIGYGLPTILTCKLKYHADITLDIGAAGILAQHTFTANSCYDPDSTGTGQQPRCFDQIMTMYDHFVVLWSKITVKFCPRPDLTSPATVVLAMQDDTTVHSFVINMIERKFSKSSLITPGTKPTTLSMVFKNKFLGRTKPLADPDLKGSLSGDPSELAFFVMAAQSIQGIDETPIVCLVDIDYICAFIEPKLPPQS